MTLKHCPWEYYMIKSHVGSLTLLKRDCRVTVGREVRGRRRSLAHCQELVDASPGSLYSGGG